MIIQLDTAKGWGRDKSLADRFHRSYIPVTESGCWIWIAKYGGGLGGDRGVINDGAGCKTALAHRVSWELHFGPIPAGMVVCHRCDVGACVNPHHLFIGSQRDNLRDMIRKGRRHNQKLNWAKVKEIRESTDGVRVLAARYGVLEGSIYNILAGTSWRVQ